MKKIRYNLITFLLISATLLSSTSVLAVSANTARTTRTIVKDTVYSGTLTAGSTDTYYFTPTYSGMFTVETFGSTDTYGTVSGNNGSIFPTDSNDDAGSGTNFAIGFYQEAGNTTTITVRHYNSTSGTGSYTLQVRDQRAQIYTFDYGNGDIDTTADSETPRSWLSAMGYSVGVYENKEAAHIDATIASTFKRLNSEVFFFSGHGMSGSVCFMSSSGYNYLNDTSSYFGDMSNTKVAVWSACYSAVDPDGTGTRKSMAQKSIDKGARSAIGWTEVTNVTAAKKWTDQFFLELGNTMTVEKAAASAGSIFLWPWDGSYDGWQVFGDGSTLVSYPTANAKSAQVSIDSNIVDENEFQSFLNSGNYETYQLKGLGTRYYRTVNGCLTNDYYDIYTDGNIKKSSTSFSINDINEALNVEIDAISYSSATCITAYGMKFDQLVSTEEHTVYMKLDGNIVPIKLIYANYQNDEGMFYQDVTCINLINNQYIDYSDICTK